MRLWLLPKGPGPGRLAIAVIDLVGRSVKLSIRSLFGTDRAFALPYSPTPLLPYFFRVVRLWPSKLPARDVTSDSM